MRFCEGISGFVCEGLHDSGFLYRENGYLCRRFRYCPKKCVKIKDIFFFDICE